MKRMLVNVIEPEESRVAIVEGDELLEYHLQETPERSLLGNIYLGRIVNVEPGIQAAFIDIGEARSAFVHVSDVHPAYAGARRIPFEHFPEKIPPEDRNLLIQDVLRKGQTVLVQVTKESIGHKGPSVTTYVSLPGRYLVLMVGMTRSGVSKKIEDPDQRARLRKIADALPPVENAGFIVRTAGESQSKRDLERDLRYLKQVWQTVTRAARKERAPALLYEESDLVIRTIRDLFDPEIEEILVDSAEMAQAVRDFLTQVMPRYASRVHHYEGNRPIFFRFDIESEIESIYERKVPLPSGGSLVIEETEALVAIDVNSGRYRKEEDLEATALQTNLEAAVEIARQLRLRDIGGVVICDYIDMVEPRNRRRLEQAVRDNLRHDRAKTWISRVSRFGIVEMTRQRLRPSKEKVGREVCATCQGRGTVRSPRSVATGIFRQLKRGLGDRKGREAVVTVGNGLLDELLNRRRQALLELEKAFESRILVKLDLTLPSDQFEITFR